MNSSMVRLMRAVVGVGFVAGVAAGGASCDRVTQTRALSSQDRILLLTAVNRTGEPLLDDTLNEALGLLTRQSPGLNLVSDQQLQATLRMTSHEPSAAVTSAIGRDVCARAGATVLLGVIAAPAASGVTVRITVQDCLSGAILAADRADAASSDAVFDALGQALMAMRARVGEAPDSIRLHATSVEAAATASREAFKAYSLGDKTRRTSGDFDAVPSFTRAFELDPGFALAYARLASSYAALNRPAEERQMLTRAYETRARATEPDRLVIEARYSAGVSQDRETALAAYQQVLASYPRDYVALVGASQLLRQMGRHDAAVPLLQALTRVASNSAFVWSSLGAALSEAGRRDEAKRALQTSISIQDTAPARTSLFTIGIATGDRALADAEVQAMLGRRDDLEFLRVRIAAAAYQGRFQEASTLAAAWQDRMEASSQRSRIVEGVLALAFNEALVGQEDAAGDRMAEADVDGLLSPDTTADQDRIGAITDDTKASRAWPQPVFDAAHTNDVAVWAVVQMRLERWAEAEEALQWLLGDGGSGIRAFDAIPAFAMASLARAQVALGQADAARKTYERFFAFWKDADADLPLILRARAEYETLGS